MIELYADGSCPRPHGPGGWAFVVVGLYEKPWPKAGGALETTNNRMELTAVIKGLEFLVREDVRRVRVISDSQYVIYGLEKWCHTWKQNGWKRKDDKRQWVDVGNKDLWKIIYGLAHVTLKCEFKWQRGHVGERYNEWCDELAGEQAWALIEK